MINLGNKVRITSQQKTDGRYNIGKVIGVEFLPDAYYLGYTDEREFLSRFTSKNARYKVAYVDCATDRACAEWYGATELSKELKVKLETK